MSQRAKCLLKRFYLFTTGLELIFITVFKNFPGREGDSGLLPLISKEKPFFLVPCLWNVQLLA